MPRECPKHKVIAVRIIKIRTEESEITKGAIKRVNAKCVKNQIDFTGFHFTKPAYALVKFWELTLCVFNITPCNSIIVILT
ncbi:hypothetical protein N476_03995 [Pseudoalteromonas luteoviolacea H33]|uniref:Uncharacterized protein n=1 Tax=Pseudoalteromonas luteoviolacea H33 TaxID=1365251 RepID=A0A167BA11_9GAMM|nr:hypothetical protein N476_03995 [Pseudoalteromonas luteoviolacea H33]